MLIDRKWYIIAGAPGAGKTTTIKRLVSLGYAVTPEAPRLIINKAIKKGKTMKEIRGDEAEFQKKVFRMKVRIENKILPGQLTFLDDGGLPACIAYYQISGLDQTPIIKEVKKRKYRGVFFLEPLPYRNDYARIEDKKTAKLLHKLLYKTYQNLGYKVIRVPVKPVEERIKFILNRLDDKKIQ